MKRCVILVMGLVLALSLTGCFGESYDYSPPTVKLSMSNDSQIAELTEANIDWHADESYNKETKDIMAFASKQKQMYFHSGEQVDLLIEDGEFDADRVNLSIWQNDKQLETELNEQSFFLPKDKGAYVMVVELATNSGTAQYVGTINIMEE